MVMRKRGRILVISSIADNMPGAYQLVYNSTKAFVNNFCVGLANEVKHTDFVISWLMPSVTDTNFFGHAGMENMLVGKMDSKADPAKVARDGYWALLKRGGSRGQWPHKQGTRSVYRHLPAEVVD